jgi:acetyl/propionyl-CoA carboxylase alpha subunit
MEARIYAEDPDNGFLPGNGLIKILREPKRIEG